MQISNTIYQHIISGDLGCSADALRILDEACSGQPSCSYTLPTPELVQIGCTREHAALYLEASYECYEGKQYMEHLYKLMSENGLANSSDLNYTTDIVLSAYGVNIT